MSTAVFPNGGRSVVEQLCAKFPELHVNEDEKQRELMTRIQQQFVYQWGNHWGGKKRTGLSDADKSKDSMAYLESSGACSVWDVFQGNDEATILVHDGDAPSFADLPADEATFMPVDGVNWLETTPPPEPEPVPPPVDYVAHLDAMEARLKAHDDYNTQRILDTIDSIKTQVEESLQKALFLWLRRHEEDEDTGGVV